MKHKAGASAHGTLRSYVELRRSRPELPQDVLVMQQPSASQDEVIQVWTIEDLATRCPGATLHVKDLFAAALADKAKEASRLAQEMLTWVAGDMIAVCCSWQIHTSLAP